MTISVFILNITDMRRGNMAKKLFNLTHLGIKIIAVVLLAIYLKIYAENKHEIFLSFVVPLVLFVIFLLYNCLLVHFHKKGFYTTVQSAEFYEKCRERNISDFQENNLEKAKDLYFSIFGTDKYIGEKTLDAHMEEIYNTGRKITEK